MAWLTILALIVGPIAAVQTQVWLERRRERGNRKLEIFKTLMRARGSPLSREHVDALNTLTLEFPGNSPPDTKH